MVRFKAFRFVLLGARQVVKPLVQRIVRMASVTHNPSSAQPSGPPKLHCASQDGSCGTQMGHGYRRVSTRGLCVFLGRFSFALSAVIGEWSRRELALQQQAQERQQAFWTNLRRGEDGSECGRGGSTNADVKRSGKTKEAAFFVDVEMAQYMQDALGTVLGKEFTTLSRHSSVTRSQDKATNHNLTRDGPTARSGTAAAASLSGEVEDDQQSSEARLRNTTLFTRSLTDAITSSPGEPCSRTGTSEGSSPPPPPTRSSWYVFRRTFRAPFPEYQLVDAGADLLVELLVYVVLALFLCIEIRHDAKASTRERLRTAQEHDTLAAKINELVAYINEEDNAETWNAIADREGRRDAARHQSDSRRHYVAPVCLNEIDRVALWSHRLTPPPSTAGVETDALGSTNAADGRPWYSRASSHLIQTLLLLV